MWNFTLKWKNESNSTWVNFSSFPLIKRTFSFWADFSGLDDLEWCTQTWIISVNLCQIKIIIIKSAQREVSIWNYRTYKRIFEVAIDDHKDQGCQGFEPPLLPSTENLKQNTKTTPPRRHFKNRNNRNYVDRRSHEVTTGQKIRNELLKFEH